MSLNTNLVTTIIAHHGTYSKNVKSILTNNFYESEDHNKWYGDGVYFFVPGLTNSLQSARQFLEDERQRDGKTDELSVLEVTININNDSFLDLTQNDGLQLINSYRDELLAKIETVGKKPTSTFEDHHVIRSMRKELGIEFVRGNVYIRFGIQRNKGFHSIIPNVTIFVVGNPEKNIEKASIKQVA